jgi:hypothetical protein
VARSRLGLERTNVCDGPPAAASRKIHRRHVMERSRRSSCERRRKLRYSAADARIVSVDLVLAYPPRPGTQNCSQLFQLIALSDHMSTREKLIAEADYSSASALVIFEAMAEETSVSALRHG